MTAINSRKTDAFGRSTGRRKTNGAMKIKDVFIPYRRDMLESPAFRVLSLSAHRVLARVGLEYLSHGGTDNAELPVTFQNFQDYGMERHTIEPAIAECCALGFLEVTQKGRSGNGEFRRPNLFRITYMPMPGVAPSDEWQRFETETEAKAAAKKARGTTSEGARSLRRSGGRASLAPSTVVPIQSVRRQQDIESDGFIPLSAVVGKSHLARWVKPTEAGEKPALAFQISQGNSRG